MDKQTISFRIEAGMVDELDSLADALDRDRTYLLNEAVAAYLEVQRWHIRQIKEGLRQADAGEVLSHASVKKQAGSWRKR